MTDATRILLIHARPPLHSRTIAPVGILVKGADGWRFNSLPAAHGNSRRCWPTWEKAIPRWAGGLDGTESRRLEPGETVADGLRKFARVVA